MRVIYYFIIILFFCSCFGSSSEVFTFSEETEELFLVYTGSDEFGYINKNGDILFKKKLYLSRFYDGYAIATLESNREGLIDEKGKWIIDPIYYSLIYRSGGWFLGTKSGKNEYNYIDEYINPRLNKIINLDDFGYVFEFSEDVCTVMYDMGWGLISSNGRVLNEFISENNRYNMVGPRSAPSQNYGFRNNRIMISKNDKFAYIDKTGKNITDFIYDDAGYFHHDLAPIGLMKNGSMVYGLIDLQGKEVLKPVYPFLGSITDSLIVVQDGNKYGYIDHDGNLKIDFLYNYAESFYSGVGLIGVKDNTGHMKYGYINPKGEWILEPIYDSAVSFDNDGFAVVGKGNKSGIININGEWIFPLTEYIRFDTTTETNYIGNSDYEYKNYIKDSIVAYYDLQTKPFKAENYLKGFMKIDGTIITKPVYEIFEDWDFADGLVYVRFYEGSQNTGYGYINSTGEIVWKYGEE